MDGQAVSDLLARLRVSAGGSDHHRMAEDLEYVVRTLEWIKASLADAENLQTQDEPVRVWLRDLRDLAHEAEDLLDLCGYQSTASQADIGEEDEDDEFDQLPSASAEASFREAIFDGASRIRRQYAAIAEKRMALDVRSDAIPERKHAPIDLHVRDGEDGDSSMICSDALVGREAERERLLGMLLADGAEPVELIAVVGMGGVGKTALCHHVYSDFKVAVRFGARGWVHAGESYNVVQITSDVVNCFAKESVSYRELSSLQERLIRELHGKRFLLVVDDVWCQNVQVWETVRAPLMYGAEAGSKILITTRNEDVVRAVGDSRSFQLGCLSEEYGWLLFRKHANIGDGHSRDMVSIGKDICGKCGGLPLAIKVVGSLLGRSIIDSDHWRLILNSSLWDYNVYGDEGEILRPLYLSYQYLPLHLKACFKFFNLIEKGQKYSAVMLIDLWTAHDLIKHERDFSVKVIGCKIIDNLASRSFLEKTIDTSNEVYIKVHDLILDLAKHVSGSEFCIRTVAVNEDPWRLQAHVRHLCLYLEADHVDVVHLNGTVGLRTLELYTGECKDESLMIESSSMEKLRFLGVYGRGTIGLLHCTLLLKHLRVLVIRDTWMKTIPRSLYMLFNLIKLSLTGDGSIRRVSNLIGNLRNLQSLRLCAIGMEEVPTAIYKLTALEELDLSCNHFEELPIGITRLENLQSLNLSLTSIKFLHIENLKNLRSLILGDSDIEKISDSISELNTLEELSLRGCKIRELPNGITKLTNLRSLDLELTSIECMPSGLSNLSRLMYLPYYPLGSEEKHAQIRELKQLALKQEMLHIQVFGGLIGQKTEEIQMADKGQYLRLSLSFKFSHDQVSDMFSTQHECILQFLKPHTDIRSLAIQHYTGRQLVSWMGDRSFDKLVRLVLQHSQRCESLSPLHQLSSLKELYLNYMESLADVASGENCRGSTQVYPELDQKVCFPELQILVFRYCDSLEFLPIYRFTALQKLEVFRCRQLKSVQFVDPSSIEDTNSLSLASMDIRDCQQLHFPSNTILPQSVQHILVSKCPNLRNWCEATPIHRKQKFHVDYKPKIQKFTFTRGK